MSRPVMTDDLIPRPLQEALEELEETPVEEPLEGDIVEWLAIGNDKECNNKKALKQALRIIHDKWIEAVTTLNAERKEAHKAVIDGRRDRGERLDGRPVRGAARVAKERMKRKGRK